MHVFIMSYRMHISMGYVVNVSYPGENIAFAQQYDS